jgi:hypothetical protein
MRIFVIVALSLVPSISFAADKDDPAEDAIRAAIAVLEAKLGETENASAQSKISRAIRELEAVLAIPAKTEPAPPISFDVKPAQLKKKFSGRAIYEAKSGLLSITYDFTNRDQLKDFAFANANPIVANRVLLVGGADKLTHIAKFQSFSVKGIIVVKTMWSGGVSSTNGSYFMLGGRLRNEVFLHLAGNSGHLNKYVADAVKSGPVSFQFSINSAKTSLQYATERLTQATKQDQDIHQIVFDGGTEGYGFSNIVISGIPDPTWFQGFLEAP